MKDGHSLLDTPAARGNGAARKRKIVWEVVKVGVGGGGKVGDSICVTIHVVIRVLEASSLIHHFVGLETEEELLNDTVAVVVFLLAVRLCCQIRGGGVKELGAVGDVGGAGGIQDSDDTK